MLRVIAKLDVKPPMVVKPVHFEGLRKIDHPHILSERYYEQGADEIIYIDIVASLYQREILTDFIEETAQNIFVPFGVGGGVRTIQDISTLLRLGADKVLINSSALEQSPELIDEAAAIFGSQSVVINIEAKKWMSDWECYTNCGRIRSGRSVLDWVQEVQERKAGEIIIQSVDRDGRKRGFDIDLCAKVVEASSVPVVVASGAGSPEDVLQVVKHAKPSAVAISSLLHYQISDIQTLKRYLFDNGVQVTI